MKILVIFFALLFTKAPSSIFDFKNEKTLAGKSFDLSQFKGKKILIVNTASKCGSRTTLGASEDTRQLSLRPENHSTSK